jgi:hypothetical protein
VATGAVSFQAVLAVHHNRPGTIVKVRLEGEGGPIEASTYHRFWRAGRGWAQAKELKPGDVVRTLKGLIPDRLDG